MKPTPKGGFTLVVNPLGIVTQTTWLDVANIAGLMAREPRIELFVEVGVLMGGTASMIVSRIAYDPTLAYLGIERPAKKDRVEFNLQAQVANMSHAAILFDDCFSKSVEGVVREWIDATQGPSLIFCDGGDKPAEIKHFAPMLRPGDYILTHDYNHDFTGKKSPCWANIEPMVESGEFTVDNPDHWSGHSLFLIKKA